ncbi:hypothetical protein A6V39_03175 [Candidatus Mycoplasma haematobovis]|uniref:Uncharacterized protein n=1 Tax=Candidatus Mycoplasma haematobovis TaxID=432608 RepID=A0A1A9QEH8_9MOLU|nr:hypothetical protein [Candidatus Mycoplasma haematobovis]OAL10411.1 hypothetical protein A6V39_03175 [Candidatus Mycoplasma haematobovis]
MEVVKKSRLLDLIAKRDSVLGSSINYDEVYSWLEELHYLLSSLKSHTKIVRDILSTIDSIRFHGFRFRERISQLKGELGVFERYESENIEFK